LKLGQLFMREKNKTSPLNLKEEDHNGPISLT
jgi:hypothetical protein